MSDTVSTHYLKGGFASSDDIILVQDARTRTLFRPGINGTGIRGKVIRQKIGDKGEWLDINEADFRSLPANSAISIDLDTAGTKKLYEKLGALYKVQEQGVEYGDQKYVVAKEAEVLIINDTAKHQAFKEILDKGYSEDFWAQLALSNPDLATRLSIAQVQVDRQELIRQFEAALTTKAKSEAFWQKFFEDNPWMIEEALGASVFMLNGETYLGGKQPIGRNGKGGVATDFLFGDESTKSFEVVEIKKPSSELIGPQYRGDVGGDFDNEIYTLHTELTGGVVQVRTQVTVAIENFQSVLGPGFKDKINRVHPKGVLITGMLGKLRQKQKDSFNQFRHGEHNLLVITFDEMLNRLKKLYNLQYTNTEDSVAEGDAVNDPDDSAYDEAPF